MFCTSLTGQVALGRLLALCAKSGIQLIVETHSDHLLNGIRLAVKNGELEPDETQIHYFKRSECDDQFTIDSPEINSDGRLDFWPEGFFDQSEKILMNLL